jgi:UDP-glucose 4-epimerase|tara:strand:+ start:15614 stop:16501 length:888 start_codon:yes stop_codon:yes gene_type:complete
MRVAVIGGLGFIGRSITKKLVDQGHDVRVLDIIIEKPIKGTELIVADITNFDQIARCLDGIDIVYHLAGTVVGTSRKNPRLAVNLDILGTSNVLEACVKTGVEKLIYASSFYVYDGLSADTEVNEDSCSDIFKAETFGVVKLVGERLVQEYNSRYGLKNMILRFGPAYGPSDRCTCAISDFIETGLRKKPIVIWGPGKRKNQYTYVEDIADGCVGALSLENDILNLISPERIMTSQVADILSRNYKFTIKYDLNKPEGPTMPFMSSKKAENKLNWKPVSLEEGINETLQVMKNTV